MSSPLRRRASRLTLKNKAKFDPLPGHCSCGHLQAFQLLGCGVPRRCRRWVGCQRFENGRLHRLSGLVDWLKREIASVNDAAAECNRNEMVQLIGLPGGKARRLAVYPWKPTYPSVLASDRVEYSPLAVPTAPPAFRVAQNSS